MGLYLTNTEIRDAHITAEPVTDHDRAISRAAANHAAGEIDKALQSCNGCEGYKRLCEWLQKQKE